MRTHGSTALLFGTSCWPVLWHARWQRLRMSGRPRHMLTGYTPSTAGASHPPTDTSGYMLAGRVGTIIRCGGILSKQHPGPAEADRWVDPASPQSTAAIAPRVGSA